MMRLDHLSEGAHYASSKFFYELSYQGKPNWHHGNSKSHFWASVGTPSCDLLPFNKDLSNS